MPYSSHSQNRALRALILLLRTATKCLWPARSAFLLHFSRMSMEQGPSVQKDYSQLATNFTSWLARMDAAKRQQELLQGNRIDMAHVILKRISADHPRRQELQNYVAEFESWQGTVCERVEQKGSATRTQIGMVLA